MYRIRTYNTISNKGLGRFDAREYALSPDMENPHAYILRSRKLHGDSARGGKAPIGEGLLRRIGQFFEWHSHVLARGWILKECRTKKAEI